MEKATVKTKNKILKFLPKAAQAAAVSFQNLPFSPGRDKVNAHCRNKNKGFSGPILPSMIPPEARQKSKNNFETQEPTSPKVSCMGQIKHKKKIISKKKHASLPKEFKPVSSPKPDKIKKTRPAALPSDMKKKPSGLRKIFGSGRRKSESSIDYSKAAPLSDRAPSLSQMRKFASSRDAFANFDWTTSQIAPEDHQNQRNIYSDGEREYSDGEDDVIIPFSAPILMAGARGKDGGGLALEPRKEINLWKRRTMAQPKPLNLNVVRSN